MSDQDNRSPEEPTIVDEIEHGAIDYTDQELLEQSTFNVQALFLGTVQTLSKTQGTLEAWRTGMANIFARGWDLDRTWRAEEILDALLTNYRSFGAEIIESNLSSNPPTALVAEVPDLELAESLALDPAHINELFEIGSLIVQRLGGSLAWAIDDETGDVRLSVSTGR